jgi:hypothetical protein
MPDGTRIRLAPGNHSSPREGVCVVELASVFAEEEFGDRPRCVCPVIGAFLRGWNDRAAHAERQRLGPYAARIVGSRGTPEVTRERRDICFQWVGADLTGGSAGRLLSRTAIRLRIAVFCGLGAALRPNEGPGDYAARVASARGDTESAFELLETLLATGERGSAPGPPVVTNGAAPPAVNGNGRPAKAPHSHRPGLNGNGSSPTAGIPDGDPPERRAYVGSGEPPLE